MHLNIWSLQIPLIPPGLRSGLFLSVKDWYYTPLLLEEDAEASVLQDKYVPFPSRSVPTSPLLAARAINRITSQHRPAGEVLVLLAKERCYVLKELQDLASKYWQDPGHYLRD